MQPHLKNNLDGRTFGSWAVLAYAGRRSKKQYWLCRCACGLEKEIESYNLTSGRSTSCRPCSAKTVGSNSRTHGRSKDKIYRAWQSIKTRCYNPNATRSYRHHGALGIKMSDAWLNDFKAFAAHIGEPPSPHHTIDRIDPFGHYEPGNVRWATQHEQMQNTRRSAQWAAVREQGEWPWLQREPGSRTCS
jgi:hypothetical protein